MVAPLQDLLNRINSNTLTPLQQGALATALTNIIPVFPSVDEQGNSTPIDADIPISREWIASLYALNALSPAGGSVSPTQQIAWFIDSVAGSDSNNGATAGTALKTAAALGALWRGSNGGGRPVLSPLSGTSITITLLNDLPTSDPLSVLLDVDLAASSTLVFVGGTHAPAKTSTVTTANAWARTSANGQVRITDAATADFGPFVGVAALFTNLLNGSVAWLYGPDTGASATGTLTPPYAPQIAGTAPAPAHLAVAAGNGYTLAQPIGASLGQGFVTRSFPSEATASQAEVFFYRLAFTEPSNSSAVNLASPTVTYLFQECFLRHELALNLGSVVLANCLSWHNLGIFAEGGGSVIECIFGGGVSSPGGTVSPNAGAIAIVDGDFMLFSAVGYLVGLGGVLQMGNGSFWNNGGNPAALVQGGTLSIAVGPCGVATSIFYGTDGGTSLIVNGAASSFGQILYRNDGGGTPAASQLLFTNNNFKLGDLTSPFGVNPATAAPVGPTTGTFAHLDAALGAGTGFGGQAVDPGTFSTMRLAA